MGLLNKHIGSGERENDVCGSNTYVELLSIFNSELIDRTVNKPMLIFVLEGVGELNYSTVVNQIIESDEILMFAPNVAFTIRAHKRLKILMCRIEQWGLMGDIYSQDSGAEAGARYKNVDLAHSDPQHKPLKLNSGIRNFLNGFLPCYNDGLMSFNFFELKIQELFMLFRAYYTKQELREFFKPLFCYDFEFSKFVWENYRSAHNVCQLAELSKYGLSSFKNKFKQTFGVSALKWMNERKAYNIYNDLIKTNKNLKQISAEYHLASVTHLNGFCKDYLKQTPGQIRKKGGQNKRVEISANCEL